MLEKEINDLFSSKMKFQDLSDSERKLLISVIGDLMLDQKHFDHIKNYVIEHKESVKSILYLGATAKS